MSNQQTENSADSGQSGSNAGLGGFAVRLRYFLIRALAGDMPVVLNMVISRPEGFKGALARFQRPTFPGMFENNVLLSKSRDEILSPKRDTWPNRAT